MSKFLTVDECSSFVMTTCLGATAEDRHLFRVWIVAACKSLGPNRDWVKVEAIYPTDFSFTKPDDHTSTIGVALFDINGCEITYRYNNGSKRIHTDRFSVNTDTGTSSLIDLSEDANYFHMSSNAGDVSYMILRYLGMPVDQEGFPLLPEDDLMAYESFCRWMWSKRKSESQSSIESSYMVWLRESDRVKGRRKMPSQLEALHTFQRYMSMIPQSITPSF